jgi:hypothetical protein
MHRNIIVQKSRIATKDKRFDLSKKDIPVKPPTSKMQQVIHAESVFDELELIMEITTRSNTTHV